MSAATNRAITSYAEFWPYYPREHAEPATRNLHVLGTGLAVLSGLGAAITGILWLIPLALLAGYGPAWVSHVFVEHNRPATYPLWSLFSD